jgi:hypothetical protein
VVAAMGGPGVAVFTFGGTEYVIATNHADACEPFAGRQSQALSSEAIEVGRRDQFLRPSGHCSRIFSKTSVGA